MEVNAINNVPNLKQRLAIVHLVIEHIEDKLKHVGRELSVELVRQLQNAKTERDQLMASIAYAEQGR